MSEIIHELYIAHDVFDGTYSFECSCGAEGDERNAEVDALADWKDHCDRVFMEATS